MTLFLKIIKMKDIKNLLFDLGGVIMDIKRSRCVERFVALGFADADKYLGEYSQAGSFAALERGDITPAEWRSDIRSHIATDVTDNDIDNAFIAFLTGIPVHRLKELRLLRKKYKIYMLSNTNTIMWNSEIARQFRSEGYEREDYFDCIVTSFTARALKPDAAIFDYARKELDIDPHETLFLDDSAANCAAAEKLGWNTACLAPGMEFFEVLKAKKLI